MARILVIEDEKDIREAFRIILSEAGYAVSVAADGAQGISRFNEASADLVITDILMPEKDGLETISELRKINPGLKIIAISGGGKHLDPETCIDLAMTFGACLSLKKPVKRDKLLEAVKQALSA